MSKHTVARRLIALSSVVLSCMPGVAHANLVNNGSFELTGVGTTTSFQSAAVSNWSNSDIGELLVTPSWYTNGYLVPGVGLAGAFPQTSPDGGNFVLSDGDYHNSPIVQTINGLVPGNVYQLSFYQALAQDTEANVTVPGPVRGQWQVTLGPDVQLSPLMFGDGSTLTFSPWKQQTMMFTAHTATEVLSFLSVGAGDPPMVGLDGVNLAAVPEPDALALLAAGGLLLGWKWRAMRRRDAAPAA